MISTNHGFGRWVIPSSASPQQISLSALGDNYSLSDLLCIIIALDE